MIVQIISALSDFTPKLLNESLNLSPNIAGISTRKIAPSGVQYSAYQAGRNGVWTAVTATVVVNNTYYLDVSYTQNQGALGIPIQAVKTYTAVAATTSFSDLTDQFVALIKSDVPFTAANTGSVLVLTEAPFAGFVAGEAKINAVNIWCNGVVFAAFTNGTTNLQPIGNPTVLARLNNAGNSFYGTINTAHTYDLFTVTLTNNVQYLVAIDLAIVDTLGNLAFIKSAIKLIQAQLGGTGDALTVTAIATAAANAGIIPLIYNGKPVIINITSGADARHIALPAGFPVGARILFKSTVGFSSVIECPTLEGINDGAAGGTTTLVKAKYQQFTKVSTTNWDVSVFDNPGASDSSTAQIASA